MFAENFRSFGFFHHDIVTDGRAQHLHPRVHKYPTALCIGGIEGSDFYIFLALVLAIGFHFSVDPLGRGHILFGCLVEAAGDV